MKKKSKSFSKPKPSAVVDWILSASSRSSQRRALAEKWLDEKEFTNYRYYVETCEDRSWVYLLRPTWLNRGFDFQVNLEGFKSKTRNARGQTKEMPSHDDVLDDLSRKVKAKSSLASELFDGVCDTYDCIEPDEVLKKRPRLRQLKAGLPIDKTLRIIKWLFIEQDLTYWLGTGRNMLMRAIESEVFHIGK